MSEYPFSATVCSGVKPSLAGWFTSALCSSSIFPASRLPRLAAIISGEHHITIIYREILPNMSSLIVSCFIGATVYAIGAQVGLEFLGLGDVSAVTWGTNLYWASNDAALLTGSWWTFVPTGFCVAMVGFALVMINNAIDEITNPRLQSERTWATVLGRAGLHFDRSVTAVMRNHD